MISFVNFFPNIKQKIDLFCGEHALVSNYYKCEVEYGRKYPSAEHAYQALKCLKESDKKMILNADTPEEARRLGRRAQLVPGWFQRKDYLMECIFEKYGGSFINENS